jgi:hypothetical protein
VDFSDLSSEYIGILYEGLLDFELRPAPGGDPVIFLAIGNQPALPLSRLEAMDDAALASLLEKMKHTREDDSDEGDETEEEEAVAEEPAEDSGDDFIEEEPEAEEEVSAGDARHTTRTRAEIWARRAVVAGKLTPKPRGKLTPEKRLQLDAVTAKIARQLVSRVVLPGEWYLVRWGGTRKGLGTFYTRPDLAVPTVQRTLRPLAYTPPSGIDGSPDIHAPNTAWVPKKPEVILALKVCDPACGSGTFLVAALRFLTEAIFVSLHHHGRISEDGARTVVRMIDAGSAATSAPEGRLAHELLPCRQDDVFFEQRLKAVLRRHVVERSIYGVDFDPLAVELCRLALWVETMDRTLPFSFLDHKVKCGNALAGAWFDQFQHYPVMAWKNRDGGDNGHGNGVHFEKGVRTKAIKGFVKNELTPDILDAVTEQFHLERGTFEQPHQVHAEAIAVLSRLHALPVQDSAERGRLYRKELLGSPTYQSLKAAMDLWCACWFWPADEIEHAPLPTTIAAPSKVTRNIAISLAAHKRFFHWELEFPDVFRAERSGFDAIIGNPPWDTLQPNSKEFFSNIDPLYRAYGKQEALHYQTEYFADKEIERSWLDYTAGFASDSNWMKFAASPFGDPDIAEDNTDRFSIVRGDENAMLHRRWRSVRMKSHGFADPLHPYRHRGEGKAYTYKLFLEQTHALLRAGGRLGFIVPSGLYSDHGTGRLRQLFLDRCNWEWLFGFENRDGIFAIHRSFKFNAVIIEKGGVTNSISTAFMRRKLEDWERAEALATPYTRAQVERFSPKTNILIELRSRREAEIAEVIYGNSQPLSAELSASPLAVQSTSQGDINLTSEENRAWHRNSLEGQKVSFDMSGCLREDSTRRAMPIYQGAMIYQFDPAYGRYAGGRGHGAKWEPANLTPGGAQFWLPAENCDVDPSAGTRLLTRRLINATNERSMIASLIPGFPSSDTTLVWKLSDGHVRSQLLLAACLNSFAFDWVVRARLAGATGATALDMGRLQELPIPGSHVALAALLRPIAELNMCHWMFAPQWIQLQATQSLRAPRFALWAAERLRLRCAIDAVIAASFALSARALEDILADCDHPVATITNKAFARTLDQKGFWRVDKEKDPELRHSILTLVAFHDLQQKVAENCGNHHKGMDAFLIQNDGQGWMLPETLRLADYGLGHDDRAKEHQAVASRLGPRFYDWQIAQSPEESWRECHVHARNFLGEAGYCGLLAEIEMEQRGEKPSTAVELESQKRKQRQQSTLF